MVDYEQLEFLKDRASKRLGAQSPLSDASVVFLKYLEREGMSHHTVKAFRSDLNVLAEWVGSDIKISSFSTDSLNKFLDWMQNERGKPCSTKTYSRRITTLKSFFGFLQKEGVLKKNPAEKIIQITAKPSLPVILTDDELEEIKVGLNEKRLDTDKPDVRPAFLFQLLTETAIKKAEVMALRVEDFIRPEDDQPYIWVRSHNIENIFKERKIPVSEECCDLFDEYVDQREIDEILFDCTPRNLEYILRDIAKWNDIEPRRKLSFEALRWYSAFTDKKNGMLENDLRVKLGLSKITWREAHRKLVRLNQNFDAD